MDNQTPLHTIVNHLQQMEQDLLDLHKRADRIQQGTNRVITIVLTVIGAFALINLYFVNDLAQEIKVTIQSMVEMYTHFGEMSQRMTHIREHVGSMSDNIKTMPIMVEQMHGMSQNMTSMQDDVAGMRGKMGDMNVRVGSMNTDITEMAQRFHHMNESMGIMTRDVREMSDVVP